MSKSKKNTQTNDNSSKSYQDNVKRQPTDSVNTPANDKGSHAENKDDKTCH